MAKNNSPQQHKGRYSALLIATLMLTLNFWAWSLISPMANEYQKLFSLSPLAISVLISVPVLMGSLAKVVFGTLTDKYGGQKMFSLISLIAVVGSLSLAFSTSYPTVLISAVIIGITGASFAIGIPFINAWFPKNKRGLALGIYSLGNAGTAVAGLVTPIMLAGLGRTNTFLAIAVIMLFSSIIMYRYGKNSPSWRPSAVSPYQHFAEALKWNLTLKLALLYSLTFGAFVAFGMYLPVILVQSYGLDPVDASARSAGFVIIATLARPIGGWLSDKISGLRMLKYLFLLATIFGLVTTLELALMPIGTVAYLCLALVLGLGNGAIFAVIGHRCDQKLVGAVNGFVSACGGLGGFFPPLILGVSFQLTSSYTIALAMFTLASFSIYLSMRKLFGYSKDY